MPYYARKSYRKPSRKYSRYPSKYRKTRSRFSKKRFNKYSSKQKTIVRAPVNARETYVKLPWINTWTTQSLGSLASSNYVFLGNSLIPFPADFTSPTPTAGDEWVSGVTEYANFYNQYRVLGSSIKLQITAQSAVVFGVCLVPIMAGGAESGAQNIAGRIAELDALTYDQLSMQPYAQTKMVGLGTGGNANCYLKMFRKTKTMLACKDIKDNENTQTNLPDPTGFGGFKIINAPAAFFYYFRMSNLTTTASSNFSLQVKMKFYTQLSGRTNWVPVTVPA